MDYMDIAKRIQDDGRAALYNKVANDLYKRFNISSAPAALLICYYLLYHDKDELKEG